MIDVILDYWLNPWFALLLYWMPLSICFVGYTLRTFENYHKDLRNREIYERSQAPKPPNFPDTKIKYVGYYDPTDTIGTLIGRAIVSIVPVCNIWAAMFDVSPRLFERFIYRIRKLFDQPLVPKRDIVTSL